MRRIVADFLEQRLCRDTIAVGYGHGVRAAAADAIDLLRRGLVRAAFYHEGLLYAEVSTWDLFASGNHAVVRRWIEAGGEADLAERAAALDQPVDAARLDTRQRMLLLLARHGAGRPVDEAALAAVASESPRELEQLRRCLRADPRHHHAALVDEPPEPLSRGDQQPDIMSFILSGNLDECKARLAEVIRSAEEYEAAGWRSTDWPYVAQMWRFLLGDDRAAMAYLERARFCDVRRDWLETFGRDSVAAIDRRLLEAIDRAFDGVPFPGAEGTSLYQAEAADEHATCDQSRDHKGRWQDLPAAQLLACQCALSYLDGRGWHYYLPAIMSFAVRAIDSDAASLGSGWIFESLRFSLGHGPRRELHGAFTAAQLAVVARFGDFYGVEPSSVAQWQAAARDGFSSRE